MEINRDQYLNQLIERKNNGKNEVLTRTFHPSHDPVKWNIPALCIFLPDLSSQGLLQYFHNAVPL